MLIFLFILHVNSCVKIRKSKFLIDFRTWCKRICSWNLLLKLKFRLQRLQIRTQTICWIDNFFIDFDVNSNVDNWKIVRSIFSFTLMRTTWIRNAVNHFAMNFAFSANKTIVDFVATSHIKLIISFEKNEQMFENFWTDVFRCSDSNVWKNENDRNKIVNHWIDLFFIDSDTISDAINEKCNFFDKMIIRKIITNSNFCFDVAIEICNSNETNEFMTIDFFSIVHNNLITLFSKRKFLTYFFECWSLLCLRNDFLKLKISSQCRHINNFFVDFDAIANVKKKIRTFRRIRLQNCFRIWYQIFWYCKKFLR